MEGNSQCYSVGTHNSTLAIKRVETGCSLYQFFPPLKWAAPLFFFSHARRDMRGEEWLSSHQTVFLGKMERALWLDSTDLSKSWPGQVCLFSFFFLSDVFNCLYPYIIEQCRARLHNTLSTVSNITSSLAFIMYWATLMCIPKYDIDISPKVVINIFAYPRKEWGSLWMKGE